MSESQQTPQMLPGKSKEELAASKLPLPERETLDDEERAALDRQLERSQRFFNSIPSERGGEYRLTPLFQGLLQSPLLAELWAGFGDFYQTSEERGSFTNRERDVGLLALVPTLMSTRTGKYPLSPIWITWAVSSGVSPKDIQAILEERTEDLAPEDRQLFELVRAVASGGLTDAHFDAMVERWNVKTAIEFISFVTWRIAILRTVQAHWGIQDLPQDSAPGFAVLQEYLDGKRQPEAHDMSSGWVTKGSDQTAGD